MGRSHALAFTKEGTKVVVSDISLENCQKVVEEVEKLDGEVIAIKCDVTKKEEVDEMVKKTIEKWGKIDILVNNAGIAQFKPFLELTKEDWDRTLDINLKGYFLLKADLKTMEATLARIPLHRVGKSEEVSNLVLFLASDASSYMTGADVIIDGGWLAG